MGDLTITSAGTGLGSVWPLVPLEAFKVTYVVAEIHKSSCTQIGSYLKLHCFPILHNLMKLLQNVCDYPQLDLNFTNSQVSTQKA